MISLKKSADRELFYWPQKNSVKIGPCRDKEKLGRDEEYFFKEREDVRLFGIVAWKNIYICQKCLAVYIKGNYGKTL